MNAFRSVRVRFAPSPTGYLHIGGVRTALFNWLFARHHGGQFILRIDDTDQQRNIEAALNPILNGFRWLGIDWDEGPEVEGPYKPYFQSQRTERYQQAVDTLLEKGLAYRDFARAEELQAERKAAEEAKLPFVYSRSWMAETESDAERFRAEGRESVVRLKMPREGQCRFTDLIRGDLAFDWTTEQDHVIQRKDGSCLYHLASVVDDGDFEISHVIRAIEHLSNTPRQIFIAQGIGLELPQYAHLPYVAEPGSSNKLSKRKLDKYLKNQDFRKLFEHGERIAAKLGMSVAVDSFNPVIVDFYRELGYLPDALVNYLLLLGWSLDDRTEHFNRDDMIRYFSLRRVNKAPASFDPVKLQAFQDRWMRNLPTEGKMVMVIPFMVKAGLLTEPVSNDSSDRLQQILEAAGDRIKIAGDILDYGSFFKSAADLTYDEKAFSKRLRKPDNAADLLAAFRTELDHQDPFDAEALERLMQDFVVAKEITIGQIIHAVRVAVTGTAVGFGMFETLAVLGKAECLHRIDRVLDLLAED